MDHPSVWMAGRTSAVPAPENRLDAAPVEVLVMGGGLCGLLTTFRLYEKGVRSLALIEAGEIAGGTSAHTTAKVTAQHGLLYARLRKGLGEEKAAQYAKANQDAIGEYARVMDLLGLPEELRRCTSYLYTDDPAYVDTLEQEAEACRLLDFSVSVTVKTELPFPVLTAVGMEQQARIHPLRFADALARYLVDHGVRLYTHTRADPPEADQTPGEIRTNRGTLHADTVILATHYPFMDKNGMYFARIWQERSYVLALTQVPPMENLYWAPGENGFSFRPASWTSPNGEKEVQGVLLGGKSHKTGHEGTRYHYEALRMAAKGWYPAMRVAGRWSAQDGMTHDGIPYIGRYRQLDGKLANRVYLAVGFNKWGMTTSMAAADILSEAVLGRDHPCQEVFSPTRFDPGLKAKSFFVETTDMVGNLIGPYTHLPAATSASIRKGEGKIITVDGKRVGVYKDEQDVLHTVRPICPHMGCVLQWNRDEKSWDCPCHGSRFDIAGRLLNDPAQTELEDIRK